MASTIPESSRRSFLYRLGFAGAAPALLSALGRETLAAQKSGAQKDDEAPSAAPDKKIWSNEYWAERGNLKLYLFRKRLNAPHSRQGAEPVLFLVHGSSISGRPTFDLSVPGHGEYSLMNKFAEYGFDVWTMDFSGYGRSSVGEGNSNIADGVADLKAAVEVVARETGQQRYHFFGESSGALRAGAYATEQPQRINRLVLTALTYTGEGSPTLSDRAKQLEFYRTHNRRPRDGGYSRAPWSSRTSAAASAFLAAGGSEPSISPNSSSTRSARWPARTSGGQTISANRLAACWNGTLARACPADGVGAEDGPANLGPPFRLVRGVGRAAQVVLAQRSVDADFVPGGVGTKCGVAEVGVVE